MHVSTAAHDGGCVSLVHPASIYRKRQLPLPNTPEGKTRLESHASTVHSDYDFHFVRRSSQAREAYIGMPLTVAKGMPTFLSESVG